MPHRKRIRAREYKYATNEAPPEPFHIGIDYSAGSDKTMGVVTRVDGEKVEIVWAGEIQMVDGVVEFPVEAFPSADAEGSEP